ncbi:DUF2785 domain-containing protein [Levilactobacillus fujinensis]|uniref:DUF2785 domain-containing protein n=1 Tax=Levilactobacillus fujinensis TaxID=2486024 RepID=A0ABW1TF17_9LACO|nr:DUF2785 domain-containing protein [Levilactobacillus fujinensis]
MADFPTELQQLAKAPALSFTDDQVQLLLAHVGDLDPTIRDDTVYTLFARGLDEDAFTHLQCQAIANNLMTKRGLFTAIDQPTNDAVFQRTFSALLTAAVLDSDAQQPWLPAEDRDQFFNDALTYLIRERDQRGWVPDKGWAHGVAHGSDLLGYAWQHPQFPLSQTPAALVTLATVFSRQTAPFQFDEEPRLAMPLIQAKRVDHLTTQQLNDWLTATDQRLWRNFSFDREPAARLHNWLSFLHHLYFLLPGEATTQQLITTLSHHYYQVNGYVN